MHAPTSNHVEVSQNLIRNEAAVGRADLETVRMKDTNHDLHLPLWEDSPMMSAEGGEGGTRKYSNFVSMLRMGGCVITQLMNFYANVTCA